MSDIFPEESYDPVTGEYTSAFDFDPIYTRRVDLSSNVYVDVHTRKPDFTPLADSLADILEFLRDRGYFDTDENRNPNNYAISPADFDISDTNVRGPFIDTPSVEKFLDDSGLRGIAIQYYDPTNDEYWIDVNTT